MKILKGKIAIITGGGSGIGEGTARMLTAQGVSVMICGRREAALQRVAGQITDQGGICVYAQADVSLEADVDRVVNQTLERFEMVDILVNNAAISLGSSLHDHSIEEWDRIMAINLRGPFLMTRAVLPIMRQNRRGHIINISSESGIEHYAGDAAYGVSKHALNDLTEYTQIENQEFGIKVNAICPGMVVTEMSENSPGLNHDKCLYPDDVAEVVVWLLTRRQNIKIGTPILFQTMENPWES